MDKFQISEAILEHTVILNDIDNVCEVGGLDEASDAILAIHNQEVAILKERIKELEDTIRGEMSYNLSGSFKIL